MLCACLISRQFTVTSRIMTPLPHRDNINRPEVAAQLANL